jgi:hypothetical protein
LLVRPALLSRENRLSTHPGKEGEAHFDASPFQDYSVKRRRSVTRVLDFRELPSDGVAFEQLTREILFLQGLTPHWTGAGVDGGRDLVVEETVTGPLHQFSRRWLVSCKHSAHSGRPVGKASLGGVKDDCSRVGAQGYLLVCSTHPSSGSVQHLAELASNLRNDLVTATWDAVYIERELNKPRGHNLAHIFFPESMRRSPWKILATDRPNLWAAHYKDKFFYLSCRDANHFEPLNEIEVLLERLGRVKPKRDDEHVRPRAFYLDDCHYTFYAYVDYLVPRDRLRGDKLVQVRRPSLTPTDFNKKLRDGIALAGSPTGLAPPRGRGGLCTFWDVELKQSCFGNDHFHLDHRTFYSREDMESFTGSHPRKHYTVSGLDDWDSPAPFDISKY